MINHRTAVNVGVKLHLLADPDFLQLDFLEVGIDVHLLHRRHRQQWHPRLHPLPQLHLTLGDNAIHRCPDHRAFQIHRRLVAPGAGEGHFRIAFLVCTGNQHGIGLTRTQGRRAVSPGLRRRRPGCRQIRLCPGIGISGAGQFLAGNRTGGSECLAARQVDFCAGNIRLGSRPLCSRPLLVGITGSNLRRQTAVIGDKALDTPPGPPEIRLRLRQSKPGIRRVDPDQHIALFDCLRIRHQHLADRPADGRRDLSDFNGGVGVIGGHKVRRIQIPVGGSPGAQQQHQRPQPDQLLLAPSLLLTHVWRCC